MAVVDVNKINVVTVTYSNRLCYLTKVVNRLLEEGVKHIIVVDNNSSDDIKFNQKEVSVVHSNVNLGASGGFKLGLKEALKTNCDYFLLLDDDNLIDKGIINKLCERASVNDVLFCFRHYDCDFLIKRESELKINNLERDTLNVNSFCYFSFEKLVRIFNKMFVKSVPNGKKEYKIVANGYGGCFFNKRVLDVVGFPKEKYSVYWGDVGWTYSMFKKGFDLFLLSNCKVKDLEQSLIKGRVKSYFKVGDILDNLHECSEKKLISEYKDRVKFEKEYIIFDRFWYSLNRLTFYWLIFPIIKIFYKLRFKETKNLDLLLRSVKEGEKYED